jgi:hypothetical protein
MWRRAIGSGYLLVAFGLAAACGGNVEGGSKDPQNGGPSSDPTKPVSNEGQGTDNPGADTDLGACVLGPPENRATDKPCAWVADGNCYQSREMACNCACPRSHNSQCASGFESGPDGHVWVDCN